MHLGRRLSSGVAQDPPAPAAPAEPTTPGHRTATAASSLASPDDRAAEIVAAAAQRELGGHAVER